MRKLSTFLLFSLLFLGTYTLSAQRDFSKVEIKTIPVSDQIYMLQGSGGNIAVLTGADGVFMIDDQFAPLTEKILAAIAKISEPPVKFLINTHWHGDHTGGNENMGKAGAVIVAHDNVRKRMSEEQLMVAFGRTVPPAPADALPVITFSKDIHFHWNEEHVFIFHVHHAHTDGDVIVHFTKANVMHTGDTYFKGRFPFYDVSSGGSVEGLIESANKLLFIADDETVIIPGHGDLSNKKELTEYRDMLIVMRDRVKEAIASGKSFEEIEALGLAEDLADPWGQGFINAKKFVSILYSDLTREE